MVQTHAVQQTNKFKLAAVTDLPFEQFGSVVFPTPRPNKLPASFRQNEASPPEPPKSHLAMAPTH